MRHVLFSFVVLAFAAPVFAVDKASISDAIDRGVLALKKMQRADGTWPYDKTGATSLAALTLLECNVDKDDRSITRAADAVRKSALTTLDTYSLALNILFLDRLGNDRDTPLIEAMVTNLMAGQKNAGYGYTCVQAFTAAEQADLLKEASGELRGGRDLTKLPARGKREGKDTSKIVQAKFPVLAKIPASTDVSAGLDNSNSQFATLALWVGRRYGMPTQAALAASDTRLRLSQGTDGGWGYSTAIGGPALNSSTATMTCAGLLGLACGHGAIAEIKKVKEKEKGIDTSKDVRLKAGLQVLATAVGVPVGWDGKGKPPAAVAGASGKAYYFLWSLERVCVLLDLETIGKRDWYNWGAEIILANQNAGGAWTTGEYSASGADTCFALLFLRKANLARDLTGRLAKIADPGVKILKSGGVGGDSLKGGGKPLAAAGIGDKKSQGETRKPTVDEETAGRLSKDLLGAKGQLREGIIKKLRDSKGSAYTEALATVIPKLEADSRKLARAALADRLTRMKPATLRLYLKEADAELRCGAALAAGQRDAKELIPDLISLLDDKDALVQRAAHASLKAMAGKDLGTKQAVWLAWWKKQARE